MHIDETSGIGPTSLTAFPSPPGDALVPVALPTSHWWEQGGGVAFVSTFRVTKCDTDGCLAEPVVGGKLPALVCNRH